METGEGFLIFKGILKGLCRVEDFFYIGVGSTGFGTSFRIPFFITPTCCYVLNFSSSSPFVGVFFLVGLIYFDFFNFSCSTFYLYFSSRSRALLKSASNFFYSLIYCSFASRSYSAFSSASSSSTDFIFIFFLNYSIWDCFVGGDAGLEIILGF